MAAGISGVRLLTVVRVSSSSDRCLIVSHLVCKVVIFNRKKLTLVERCRSNYCVNNSVNVFRLMQERKYVCGEQLKIRILQQYVPDGQIFCLRIHQFPYQPFNPQYEIVPLLPSPYSNRAHKLNAIIGPLNYNPDSPRWFPGHRPRLCGGLVTGTSDSKIRQSYCPGPVRAPL